MDHQSIPQFHRGQLFSAMKPEDDLQLDAVLALKLLSFLGAEESNAVWNQATAVESIFSKFLFGTTSFPQYQLYIQWLTKPHIDRLGFESVSGESAADSNLRSFVAALSCQMNQNECLLFEMRKLLEFLSSGQGSYNLCEGLKLADEPVHAYVVDKMLAASDAEKFNLIFSLGCSLNREALENLLNLVLDESNGLNSYDRSYIVQYTMGRSVVALDVALEFILQNYEAIEQK